MGNWGIIKTRYDPGDQLDWLEKELASLEAQNGQAIFISHIPPYKECAQSWQMRFRSLMERYQNVVRAGFYGHTHKEGIALTQAFYKDINIGLSFNTGSLSTYTDRNPSFALIEFDAEYMIPVSYKTYYLDLDKANQQNQPHWELLHDFQNEYGISDLSPDSLRS